MEIGIDNQLTSTIGNINNIRTDNWSNKFDIGEAGKGPYWDKVRKENGGSVNKGIT